jgi:hypothetical protein
MAIVGMLGTATLVSAGYLAFLLAPGFGTLAVLPALVIPLLMLGVRNPVARSSLVVVCVLTSFWWVWLWVEVAGDSGMTVGVHIALALAALAPLLFAVMLFRGRDT